MHRFTLIAAALASVAFTSVSLAGPPKEPHADIWLRPEGGQMFTGSIAEGTPGDPIAASARVFGADLGEDPEFPFAATEPGFQSLPGRDTANGIFSFSIPGPLLRWTGAEFVASDAIMTLAFGPASVETADGPVAGFNFATQPSGLLHDHFDFTLIGPNESDPSVGVYALPISFGGVTPIYLASPTAWIVFNLDEDEVVHDNAIRHAELFLACGIDRTGDGTVNAKDLAVVLGAWGTNEPIGDVNDDGSVDATDLALVLGAWGFTCE